MLFVGMMWLQFSGRCNDIESVQSKWLNIQPHMGMDSWDPLSRGTQGSLTKSLSSSAKPLRSYSGSSGQLHTHTQASGLVTDSVAQSKTKVKTKRQRNGKYGALVGG